MYEFQKSQIEDEGCLLSPRSNTHVFSQLSRVHNSRSGHPNQTGLPTCPRLDDSFKLLVIKDLWLQQIIFWTCQMFYTSRFKFQKKEIKDEGSQLFTRSNMGFSTDKGKQTLVFMINQASFRLHLSVYACSHSVQTPKKSN